MSLTHFGFDSRHFPELFFALLLPAQLSPPPSVCIYFTSVLNIILHTCLVIHRSIWDHLFKTVFHSDSVLQTAGHLSCKDAEHKCVPSKSLESLLESAPDHGKVVWDSLLDWTTAEHVFQYYGGLIQIILLLFFLMRTIR